MEVIFGVQATDGALRLQLSEEEVANLRDQLEELFSGSGGGKMIWVTDNKTKRTFGIPTDKLAFVEFGDEASRTVGFSAAS